MCSTKLKSSIDKSLSDNSCVLYISKLMFFMYIDALELSLTYLSWSFSYKLMLLGLIYLSWVLYIDKLKFFLWIDGIEIRIHEINSTGKRTSS